MKNAENFARLGFATKGAVYFLIGLTAALAAFGFSNEKLNFKTVIKFIEDQWLGKVLVAFLVIGLLCYVFFLFYKTFVIKLKKRTLLKIANRAGLFLSGIFYLILAYSATLILVNSKDTKKSSADFAQQIFNSEYANILSIVVGCILVGRMINEFYVAYHEIYNKEMRDEAVHTTKGTWFNRVAKTGYIARGIIFGIMGFLAIRGGLFKSPTVVKESDAFSFIEYEIGAIGMALLALAFALYGVFFLIKSRHSDTEVGKD